MRTTPPRPPEKLSDMSVIERAIEMASSGCFHSVNHVRQALIREGYGDVGMELKSPLINTQLVALIRSTKHRIT